MLATPSLRQILWLNVLLLSIAVFSSRAKSDEVVVTALFQVSSEQPSIFPEHTTQFNAQQFALIKKSQLALLRSHFVLSAAVRNPKITALPLFASVEDPVEWLQRSLQVEFPQDAEVLAIRLRGAEGDAD